MRKDRDFEIRTIIRNGSKMRVRIPMKTISEEEFKKNYMKYLEGMFSVAF